MIRRIRESIVLASALAAATLTGALAVNADAPSPAAAAVPAVVDTPSPSSPSAPSAPAGLTVSVTSGSAALSWTASTPGCCTLAGYRITYQQVPNDVIWQTDIADVTTYTVTTNIRPATQYQFRVAARDVAGNVGPSSNAVTVVTPASDSGPDTVPPSTPGTLAASSVTATGAVLTWSPSTDNVGVTGYRVYRYDGLGVSTTLATVAATSYPVALSGALNMFYVRAVDAAGNVSAMTNLLTVNPASPSPSPSRPTEPSCLARYTVMAQWTGGFVAGVTVTNLSANPVTGWRLSFTFGGDQKVTSAWSASATQSGASVTLADAGWNAVIPGGGSASMGMQGTWVASNTAPFGFTLNGAPCALG